jgi:hypothetical protein
LGPGFLPYQATFTGGLNIAVGRVEGREKKERIIAAPARGRAAVGAFTASGAMRFGFPVYDPAFKGGVFVAAGDVDGDGVAEIVTGPGTGGGPHVRVFRPDGTERFGFFAYAQQMTGGVRVAVGDLSGDGRVELVTVPGPGYPSQVRVFTRLGKPLTQYRFLAYDPAFLGGAYVSVGRQ